SAAPLLDARPGARLLLACATMCHATGGGEPMTTMRRARTADRPAAEQPLRDAGLPLAAPALPAGGDPQLARDAAALQRALSDLIRVYQFRDRDRICCHDISVSQCYALEALVE